MRLLYINKFRTNAGWGAETHLGAALRNLGIELVQVDYEENRGAVASAIRRCPNFDVVLAQRGTGYLYPMEVLSTIKRPKILVFTELVSRNPEQVALFNSRLFDKYFVRTPSCKADLVKRFGVSEQAISIFLSSTPTSCIVPVELDQFRKPEVLFCGTITPRRATYLAQVERHLSDAKTAIRLRYSNKYGKEMFNALQRSYIALNIHGTAYEDTETRVYEVLGAGCLLITEKLSSESPFQAGKHLIEVDSPQEMAKSIIHFFRHPEQGAVIADAGRAEVVRHHTYEHRAKLLRDVIVELSGRSGGCGPSFVAWQMSLCDSYERLNHTQRAVKYQLGQWAHRLLGATASAF